MVLRRSMLSALALAAMATVAIVAPTLAQQGRTVNVTIGPGRNEATASGTATLTDLGGGKTEVVVKVTSPYPNMINHIHVDVCPGVGAVVFPLNNVQNSQPTTTIVDASLSDILSRGKAINLHISAEQAAVYVGCGNLEVAGVQATPAQLPRSGDLGAIAPLAAAAGAALAGAGYWLRRRAS